MGNPGESGDRFSNGFFLDGCQSSGGHSHKQILLIVTAHHFQEINEPAPGIQPPLEVEPIPEPQNNSEQKITIFERIQQTLNRFQLASPPVEKDIELPTLDPELFSNINRS